MIQTTVVDMFKEAEQYKPSSQRAMSITNKVSSFIIKDLRPFSIVEDLGFKELVQALDPKYCLLSKP
jgi:hypothetical protein